MGVVVDGEGNIKLQEGVLNIVFFNLVGNASGPYLTCFSAASCCRMQGVSFHVRRFRSWFLGALTAPILDRKQQR